jgi:hypothetical protein
VVVGVAPREWRRVVGVAVTAVGLIVGTHGRLGDDGGAG